MSTKSKKNDNPLENYETHIAQLEHIISALEQGELSLDQALTEYEQGIKLIRSCQQALDSAEQKVRLLTQANSEEERLLPYQENDPPKTSAGRQADSDDDIPF